MQNCRAIQTLPLQSCSWETFSNRECSLESSKACFINQLNPVSSSLQLQSCGDRDGWETGALSEITPQHCKTQQRGPLQWGALPRSASRKGKSWALSHPNSPWVNALYQQERICCHLTANNIVWRTISLLFTIMWLWEWQSRMDLCLTNFLEAWIPSRSSPSDSHERQISPSTMGTQLFWRRFSSSSWGSGLFEPTTKSPVRQYDAKIKGEQRHLAEEQRTGCSFFLFLFFPDDLILYDKTVQRTSFLLYWKYYKQKGISKKELEEKEKAFSACKCFIRTVNPVGHIKHLPLELESWVECIWKVCEGTHWKQISLPCLQQPYSVIAQIQRRSNFTSCTSICEF